MKKLIILSLFTLVSTLTFAQLKEVKYNDGANELKGLITKISKSKKGVLILPAWKGIDNEAKQAALDLEKLGFTAFIADIYGVTNKPKDNNDAKKLSSFYKENYKEYQNRIKVALDELIKQGVDENKIAIIGYCFGGTGAIEAARAQFKVNGIVSIHGGLAKAQDRPNNSIATKVLVLHGADDQSVPEKDVEALRQELKAGKTDWQLIYYANCKHTFTNPESADYNPIMAKRSWSHLTQFLNEIL